MNQISISETIIIAQARQNLLSLKLTKDELVRINLKINSANPESLKEDRVYPKISHLLQSNGKFHQFVDIAF